MKDLVIEFSLVFLGIVAVILFMVTPFFIETNNNATLTNKLNEARYVCEEKQGVFGMFQPNTGELFKAICLDKEIFNKQGTVLATWEIK